MQLGINTQKDRARGLEEGRAAGEQAYQHMHSWSWNAPVITSDELVCGLGRFEVWGREVKQIADALPNVSIRGRYGHSRLNVTARMVTFSPSLVNERDAPLAETFLIRVLREIRLTLP
jgi:hypothetical protein